MVRHLRVAESMRLVAWQQGQWMLGSPVVDVLKDLGATPLPAFHPLRASSSACSAGGMSERYTARTWWSQSDGCGGIINSRPGMTIRPDGR